MAICRNTHFTWHYVHYLGTLTHWLVNVYIDWNIYFFHIKFYIKKISIRASLMLKKRVAVPNDGVIFAGKRCIARGPNKTANISIIYKDTSRKALRSNVIVLYRIVNRMWCICLGRERASRVLPIGRYPKLICNTDPARYVYGRKKKKPPHQTMNERCVFVGFTLPETFLIILIDRVGFFEYLSSLTWVAWIMKLQHYGEIRMRRVGGGAWRSDRDTAD